MNGSRFSRVRSRSVIAYAAMALAICVLMIRGYNSTVEMARFRELHRQCAHQQEALAAQLQVIFEYKVRLEKSLAEEKSSNAAVKQELQERATREKSLRDKDSVEAMQRFNSLQQTYKLLQTEHQDLQDECKKREKQALKDTNRLETTLQDLRVRMRQAQMDKDSLEHLKSKYLELDTEKARLEEKYNDLLKSVDSTNSNMEHLKKEVFQLSRELEESKKSCKAASVGQNFVSPQPSQQVDQQTLEKLNQVVPSQQQQQQVSRPNNDDDSPQPLRAPIKHRAIGAPISKERVDDDLPDQVPSKIGFAQKDGKIVPVGPNDAKDDAEPKNSLPLPYKFQKKQEAARNADDNPTNESTAPTSSTKTPVLIDSSTKAALNVASTPFDKALPLARSLPKVKIPAGVLPIPVLPESEDKQEEPRKKMVVEQNPIGKNSFVEIDSREKERLPNANLGGPFLDRHVDQVVGRRNKDWLKVGLGAGVQEIGDDNRQLGRLGQGLDDGAVQQGVDQGNDQYEGVDDYEKDAQQKNNDIQLVEEEEGEDEDDQGD